jgi:hypothetical protein
MCFVDLIIALGVYLGWDCDIRMHASGRINKETEILHIPFKILHAGIAYRYSDWLRTGRPKGRSSSPCRVKNFLFSTSSRPALGSTQPPIQWVPWALFPGVKRPGYEADHSPPTSAEVKKIWIYTSIPPYVFIT